MCVCVCVCSLVPRPHPAFIACSTEKWGEPGIFSHVSDITTNEKLMNVGGLKLNGVIPSASLAVRLLPGLYKAWFQAEELASCVSLTKDYLLSCVV